MRIKTNIIEFKNLKKTPCKEYLSLFKDGKIDAHKAFKELGEQYGWLYKNSNYDLIGWEIENNCFDWKENSWIIAMHCPQHFDAKQFNWKIYSWSVAKYCPQFFDTNKYNWETSSDCVVLYCPQYFDASKYNWQRHEYVLKKHTPHLLVLKP